MQITKSIALMLWLVSLSLGVTINLQGGVNLSEIHWEIGSSFLTSGFSSPRKPAAALMVGVDYLNRGAFNLSSNIGVHHKAAFVEAPIDLHKTMNILDIEILGN